MMSMTVTQQSLLIFYEILRNVLLSNAYKNVRKIVYFLNRQILKKQSKIKKKQNKSTHTHRFSGIVMHNTCTQFQGKIVSSTLVEAPGSFCLLKQKTQFLVKGKFLSKIAYHYFSVQNRNNQTILKEFCKRYQKYLFQNFSGGIDMLECCLGNLNLIYIGKNENKIMKDCLIVLCYEIMIRKTFVSIEETEKSG